MFLSVDGIDKNYDDMDSIIPNFGLKLVLSEDPAPENVPLRKWARILVYNLLQKGMVICILNYR